MTTNKKALSERDICTKYITPAIQASGWDIHTQVREEVSFTDGRVIVRGKIVKRGVAKRADYIVLRGATVPRILKANLISTPIQLLPPLAEQKRIVAKVDQLLSQCDELSARLRERQSAIQQLLTATIHHLLDEA